MDQKAFSIADKIEIFDDKRNVIYYIEGEVFSFGRKLHVYDLNQNEVCFIYHELFHWRSNYVIEFVDGYRIRVVRLFSIFKMLMEVKDLNWIIEGSKLSHQFEIRENNKLIACISREWFTLNTYYHIHVEDENNKLLVLAVTIAVNAMLKDAAASSTNNAAANSK